LGRGDQGTEQPGGEGERRGTIWGSGETARGVNYQKFQDFGQRMIKEEKNEMGLETQPVRSQ
jgi:hypothetical protein